MKNLTLLLVFIVISISLISQTPQAFKYQAVVRNDIGEVINNQTVSFRMSVHDSIATGTIQYQETHAVMTDAYGHANLDIGNGTPTIGAFSDIDWNDDDKFLEVEFDHLGGIAYASMGTIQLLAVPFAMYSEATGDTSRWNKVNDDLYYDNGNVGIGTDNPNSWSKLDVRGNLSVEGTAYINHSDATESVLNLFNPISDWELVGVSDANRFDIRKWGDIPGLSIDENYNIGLRTTNPVVDLDIRSTAPDMGSRILLGNADNSSNIFLHGGTDTGNPYISYKGGDALRFVRYDGGLNELMRLQSDGKVAIGTDSAYTGLHLKGDGWPNSFIALQSDKGNDAGIRFYEGDTAKWHIFNNANDSGLIIYNFNGQKVTYFAHQETGNVGIGTVNPLNKLHIQDVDISLKEPDLLNELIVIEDLDAGMGLYSLDDGGFGSVISLGEIASGSLNNKWSIFRTTSIYNGFENQLRFSYGTDPSYAVNPTFMTLNEDGNLGIGTTTPTELLEVADTIYSSVGGFKFPDGSVQEIAAGNGGVISIDNLFDGKTGGGSVFLGSGTGVNDDASDNINTAIGDSALYSNTTGSYNTTVGNKSLHSNTTGNSNTASGYKALFLNTTGLNNTASGSTALFYNTTGGGNTGYGHSALHGNRTGATNTAIGGFALYSNPFGSYNTAIGYNAGRGSYGVSISGNVFIGYRAGYYELGDNNLYIENSDTIAPLIYGEFDNDIVAINGDLGVGTSAPSASLHVDGTDGALFEGTFGSGTLPTTGSGTKLMWYPAKAAFRAGYVSGTQWDDANIGSYSIAMGNGPTASGSNSIAIGRSADATGTASTSIGDYTEASGNYATSMGRSTIASGDYSTAMGTYINISGAGSFVIGDHSTTTAPTFSTDNRFYARFANGYRLYTNSSLGTGVQLLAGGTSWSTISDSTKKEKFKTVNGEDFLNKISQFKLTSWNFKGQDPSKFRHYGPMAQDFYAAFGI